MIRFLGQYHSIRKLVFILGEGILIFSVVILASASILPNPSGLSDLLKDAWSKVLLVVLTTQIILYFNDLYEEYFKFDIVELGIRLVQSIGITSIALSLIYFFWPSAVIGKWIFLWSIVFLLLFLVLWRILYAFIIQKRLFTEKTIILGDGELAKDIYEEIGRKKESGYDIKCIVALEQKQTSQARFKDTHVTWGFENLFELAKSSHVSNIIVALDQRRGIMPYRELLSCKMGGMSIIDGESFYERTAGKILIEKINPSWLIFSDGFVKSPLSRLIKRFVGFVLSAIMLIVLSPLLLVIAVAICFDSAGGVVFSQERVGENGKVFTLFKFRSMKADAEKYSGPVWAAENDPRITKVGRIIRKLRLDELPQLWNVLRGDMSFVGPRPERSFFVEKLRKSIPYYDERFCVKPGVTGWAQVKYPYGATEQDTLEKLKFDLYYIKNMSLVLDLVVIFHTVKIVLLGRGSR